MAAINEKATRLTMINWPSYLPMMSARSVNEILCSEPKRLFSPTGFFYVPLRNAVTVPGIDDYRVILMLRDPRDVLVSLYFSVSYSHPLPANWRRWGQFAARRRSAKKMSIDEYVIQEADDFLDRYQGYIDMYLGKPNVLHLSYEQMVMDPDEWLRSLGTFLGHDFTREELAQFTQMMSRGSYGKDDHGSHIRKGLPGDHREKLSPLTQRVLSKKLKPVLERLGYER